MRIRSHLLLLAFGVVLPVVAFSVFLTTLLVRHEQQTYAQGAIERLRATMNAVDAQVQGQITVLNALASSRTLDGADLKAFEAEALRVLKSQQSWTNVILAEPGGRLLVNAAAPWRIAEKATLAEPELGPRILKTQAPVVGSVMVGPGTKSRGINLAVPVLRNGEVRFILIGFVKPELFLTPIERQRIGAGLVSGLVDSRGTFIARVPAPPAERASAGFLAAVSRAPEGWYRGLTSEGFDSYTAHVTSPFTNWSIGLGIPADQVLAPAWRTAWTLGAGIAGSLLLALFLALWLGRRVARPVVGIAQQASLVAGGKPVDADHVGNIAEVRTVALALNDAAAAVRERQALLEREKQVLEHADRAKDEFIAMLSHELRNPLAALASASQLLTLAPPQSDAARHAREVIQRQTRHTARLIEDLLDTSRVVMGKVYLQFEVFNLADAAASLIETWRSSGRFANHAVTLDAGPAWIRADRSRVEQILSNLLDNALKFSPAGTAVRVTVSRRGEVGVLEVADEGAGLTPEMLERVFDLFVQGSQDLARKSGGMGVGLALVKRLAQLQGGSVEVASAGEGRGAAFTVRFPAVPEPASGEVLSIRTTPVAHRRILLIDDNEDMRKTLAASLALAGHTVVEAGDGIAGLVLAESSAPEVVIVDIGLPGLDGYEVARRLRAAASTRATALVALTGYGQMEDRQRALEAGFDVHLTKPVDTERLERAMAAALARAGREDTRVA